MNMREVEGFKSFLCSSRSPSRPPSSHSSKRISTFFFDSLSPSPPSYSFRLIYETYLTPTAEQMANVPASVFADANKAMDDIKTAVEVGLAIYHKSHSSSHHHRHSPSNTSSTRERSQSQKSSFTEREHSGSLVDPMDDSQHSPSSLSHSQKALTIELAELGGKTASEKWIKHPTRTHSSTSSSGGGGKSL